MAITNGYTTTAQVKLAARITDSVDDALLEMSIETASRLIDEYCERRFFTNGTETRYYTANDNFSVDIDDVAGTALTLKTSSNVDGVYDLTWTAADYQVEPLNRTSSGIAFPITRIRALNTRYFPRAGYGTGVEVTGVFGFATSIPMQVQHATVLLALRQFKRYDSPLGVLGFGDVGTVRVGFVIDGQFIHCHSFHHANQIKSTYITTASLPLRYEITNTGVTTSTSTLKQVCSSVMSEGGYELRGLQQGVGTTITSPVNLITAGTYYPVISIRLKSNPNRLDAIVILTALSIMGITNNAHYNWRVIAGGTTTGGVWVSGSPDGSVEYKIDGNSVTGGRILAEGYSSASNQTVTAVDILKEALFKFQLERDRLNNTPYELSLICSSNTINAQVYASMDWEEISR